jgi:hypothetical protein
MSRIVATWAENGMQYTITATPIAEKPAPTSSGNKTEMISVFEYLGGTPPAGTGEKVYKYAVSIGAKIESKEVSSTKYTGKVMLYERQMLDVYFNADTTTIKAPDTNYVAKPAVISQTYTESDELDLPF